ncbi:hypothetical protein PQX77_003803 [Marasmius sp. AFHP31]|nr:hypothetical protein PQX77_003803 [Marasmius sp. AFHP31]
MLRPDYHVMQADIAHAHECIYTEERELERYRRELARLAQATQELEKGKLALENRLLERRSIATARRKLPYEIWDEIFTHFVDSEEYALSIIPEEVMSPALLLSHVCSAWKQRAIANPSFWSSIRLDLNDTSDSLEAVLEAYLRNSANRHLKMHIYDTSMHIFSPLEDGESANFRLLMDAMDRCSDLRIDVSMERLQYEEGSDAFSFPALVSLTRAMGDVNGRDQEHWFWRALQAAPKLTNMCLPKIYSDEEAFPFAQVRSLTIEHVDRLPLLLSGLTDFPNIERLNIVHFTPLVGTDDDDDIPIQHLGLLEGLSIEGGGRAAQLDEFFTRVTLPSLISLEISSPDVVPNPARDWLCPGLLDMLGRSGCSLQKLILNFPNLGLSTTALRPLYEAIPTLTHLEVFWDGGFAHGLSPSSTIELLCDISPAKVLLPNLTHLSFTSPFLLPCPAELLDLVEARSSCRLRELGRDGRLSALVEVAIPLEHEPGGASKNILGHVAELRMTIREQS